MRDVNAVESIKLSCPSSGDSRAGVKQQLGAGAI